MVNHVFQFIYHTKFEAEFGQGYLASILKILPTQIFQSYRKIKANSNLVETFTNTRMKKSTLHTNTTLNHPRTVYFSLHISLFIQLDCLNFILFYCSFATLKKNIKTKTETKAWNMCVDGQHMQLVPMPEKETLKFTRRNVESGMR